MSSELNNYQTDWLAQTEELNDTEASQVNGGADQYQFDAQLRREELQNEQSLQTAEDNLQTERKNAQLF
jgi:hypothetical protein